VEKDIAPTIHDSFQPYPTGWLDDFTSYLLEHVHGPNLEPLMQPKPEVSEIAQHFGGEHMPPEALDVAQIAHIAELAYHLHLAPNINRALDSAFGDTVRGISRETWHVDPEVQPLRYIFGLIRDFPVITQFIKAHEARCQDMGVDYVDIEGLVSLVERVNFESIIIKSALDYSNFLLLDEKEYLTEKEKVKMRRIITTIKTVDSPLLALTGFDALEAEILSKAYIWELEQSGNQFFATKADEVFEAMGGRQELGHTTERFMEDLFSNDKHTHDRVTADQENYEMYFSDGTVSFASGEEFRVLARLKTTGSTAKKMHNLYNKSEMLEVPMDIIGMTLIAKDKDEMQACLKGLLNRLTPLDVEFRSAPSRSEEVHVKGRRDFIDTFGGGSENADLYTKLGLNVEDEPCDNGYEAVKLTMFYTHDGIKVPVEIQITHESARKESRVGRGSHTIFKLMKLAKESAYASISDLSTDELLERLARIGARKDKFDNSSYETNGGSTTRANYLYEDFIWDEAHRRSVGSIAISR